MRLAPKLLVLALLAGAALFPSGGLRGEALALDPRKALGQYRLDSWQTKHGLPEDYIQDIKQTLDGYVWLGTEAGLVRFDGVRFTVFDAVNTKEMASDNVRGLWPGRDGGLWVGSSPNRVLRLRHGEFTAFTFTAKHAKPVQTLYEDRAGDLWIGTLGNGLVRMKGEHFTAFTAKDGLPSNNVLAIIEDRAGVIWVGTDRGIANLKNGQLTAYTERDGLAHNWVMAICESRDGGIWVGTRGGGLNLLRDGKFTSYGRREGAAYVTSLHEDRGGNLWLGTNGAGLLRFKDGRFIPAGGRSLPLGSFVTSIYEDAEGNLWVGTRSDGLAKLSDTKFTILSVAEGLPHDFAQAGYEDQETGLWVGTRAGLTLVRDGKLTTYTTEDGLTHNSVRALHRDRGGSLWIGTEGLGVNRFKDGEFTTHGRREGAGNVIAMAEDCDGSLLIGSDERLLRFADGKFTAYPVRGLKTVIVDRRCHVWVGTRHELYLFRDEEFTAYKGNDGRPASNVRSLYEDGDGDVWVGTFDNGLKRVKDGRLIAYPFRNKNLNGGVFQLQEDDRGNLWVGCKRGIYRVAKKAFDDFDAGKAEYVDGVAYDTTDGLRSNECVLHARAASSKTRPEKLMFLTVKGVVVIDPGDVPKNEIAPAVIVEEVTADGRSVNPRAPARLPPGDGNIEIHYTGVSHVAPEKIRFRYRLEGVDKEWVEAGTRRAANYANVAPGAYRFRVTACNNDGVWNEGGGSFEFYLEPHFYQTGWFYALSVAALAVLVWGGHNVRVKRMRSRFDAVLAERNRLAREIHDTLLQSFAGVKFQLGALSEKILNDPQEAKKHLDQLREQVGDNMAEARRSIWDLRSQSLEEGRLVDALLKVADQLTKDRAVKARVKVQGKPRRLSEDVEQNLLRITQEAITNAVKHAQARSIEIGMSYDRHHLRLCVRDDGHGFGGQFPASGDGEHFGLSGMRERAELIGAQLSVQSTPENGTEITVVV